MKLKGIGDCVNSKEEFHHSKLKAQVRALGTNKERVWGGNKKRKVSHCDEKRRQFSSTNVLVDRNNSEQNNRIELEHKFKDNELKIRR